MWKRAFAVEPPLRRGSYLCHTRIAAKIEFGSSAHEARRSQKPMPTKNLASPVDELRPEYDVASLTGRVQGKYHARATAGTILVLLEPDVAEAFPSGRAVNRALRMYLRSTRGKLPSKRPQPTAARKAGKRASRRRG